MQLSAVSSQSQAAAPAPEAVGNFLNYNAFLRLLVAQMKAQDPTQPADSAQYLSQLASFAAVEQGIKTNGKLDELMTSMAFAQADSLIGHTIASADGAIKGVVKSVEISAGGSYAVLESGEKVALVPGVVIS